MPDVKAQTYPIVNTFNVASRTKLEYYTGPSQNNTGRVTYYYLNPSTSIGDIGFSRHHQWIGNPPVDWYEDSKYRSTITFDFNSTVPSDATINDIKIALSSVNNQSLTATIGKLADGNITADTIGWKKFTNSSNIIYNSNITYNTNQPLSITQGSPFWNAIVAALSAKTTLTIFIRSNYESSEGSNSFINLNIYVYWTPKVSVTVQNIFYDIYQNPISDPGSKVNIDGIEYAVSSKTVSWDAGSTHTLLGWNQTINGLVYPFLQWTKTVGSTTTPVDGNQPSVSTTQNTIYRAHYGPSVVATTIDQKNSSNVSVGAVSIWENGNHFQSYTAPATKNFQPSSNQIFKGTQSIISGEKYNYWRNLSSVFSDVKNHQSFTISTTNNNFISRLNPVADGTSFQVSLPELGATYSDSIRFADPW
ncbi:MAG: hypothetical protein H3C45_10940 [Bacteroidia bacterium]|nr:hypothetical protein [Bacteroidia bacterium]